MGRSAVNRVGGSAREEQLMSRGSPAWLLGGCSDASGFECRRWRQARDFEDLMLVERFMSKQRLN